MRNGNWGRTNFTSSKSSSVLILPMRNGNYVVCYVDKLVIRVLILPMRNGNSVSMVNTELLNLVLILPMRNGNLALSLSNMLVDIVLILPMRNGNAITSDVGVLHAGFLSYLWGMETCICDMFVSAVSTFLSYLWGMETKLFVPFLYLLFFCSYPTYEEWKHSRRQRMVKHRKSSYPTYEEWKPWMAFKARCK